MLLRNWRVDTDMVVCRKEISNESWNLVPLTPEYFEAEHGGYVAAIEAALANKQIRNIALSGNYGVGKSSILQEVARRQDNRVVELSLSTLAPIEASKLDESVPIQATTPTNRIQQEIVKQLLYREDPSKTPGSRFRRIERFRWQREIGNAVLLGFAIAIIFLLTGWAQRIAAAFAIQKDLGIWINLIVLSIGTLAVLLVRWLFYGKLHIKQFSAGSATVTLNDNSVSYFDQYLDEIVYFFEVSERDIVIFEDIDRFNDSYIFETLRALNTLLNSSPQIKKPVCFIYAIKDSIFDHVGLEAEGRKLEANLLTTDDPAQAEAVRANRTKFFDLVIPVVPFITHRSARNLAGKLLGEIEHEVELELLDLAAQYVPDMRLLKNVRNEFIVFRDRIFSGDGEQLKLNETDLFAMMLYKSTHLTDFETIRIGKSKLDTLYKVSREVVTENIKKLEGERGALRQRLARIDGVSTRSAKLGENLIAHIQRTAEAASFRNQNETIIFNQTTILKDDIKKEKFWTDFTMAEANNAVLRWSNANGKSLVWTREKLAAALGDPLDAESWNEEDRKALIEKIDEKTDKIKFLRSADISDLIKRQDFVVQYEETEQPLEAIAQALLKPGLAYHLVRARYINRNFTLYTSTFHGDRVGTAATNFIIHHIERDLMDEHFELNPEDVDAIIRERGNNALKEPALYNIAILDHLLATRVDVADILISSLVSPGASQKRFLKSYLEAGEQRVRFIERLTVVSSRVFINLVSHTSLEEVTRLQLIDVALFHLSSSKQLIDSAVSDYLLTHYTEFNSLTSEEIKLLQAERISALFADANIRVPHLEPLSLQIRQSFVSLNLYQLTHNNLALAIDNVETVALDVIRTANEIVYNYVITHLNSYLEAIINLSATIDANDNFLSVIEDVLKQGTPWLGDIIKNASSNCEVKNIADVSEAAWTALAEHQRFPVTFNNVSRYVATSGAIDVHLAKILTAAEHIIQSGIGDEESKAELAIAILAAQAQLPSVVLRTKLVVSLCLENYLNVGDIVEETGELFALLLKNDIIEDELESYERLVTTDRPTRKEFIRTSKNFKIYMTPEVVQKDLALLMANDEIDMAIKNIIIEQATDYADVATLPELDEMAQFASRYGHKLPQEVVLKMAQEGVSSQQVVRLLEPHLQVISSAQLFKALQALDGDYPKLTAVGYDKPRIPNTPADLALLERLRLEGIVGKYDEHESLIKVNKRYK